MDFRLNAGGAIGAIVFFGLGLAIGVATAPEGVAPGQRAATFAFGGLAVGGVVGNLIWGFVRGRRG